MVAVVAKQVTDLATLNPFYHDFLQLRLSTHFKTMSVQRVLSRKFEENTTLLNIINFGNFLSFDFNPIQTRGAFEARANFEDV